MATNTTNNITNNMKTLATLYTLVSLFILFLSPSLAAFPSSLDTTCDITPYPAFCTTTLPPHFLSIHDKFNFFLQQSLSITKTIIELISSYLTHHSSTFPYSTLHALEDCFNLAELNTDFFSNILQDTSQENISKLHTLLSAVLTNQQTCLDGFHEVNPYPKITNALANPLSDGIKLYSISLALFTHGWVSNGTENSITDRMILNRKLLQTSVDNNVVVTQKVVVNPDGSGDFTTINDAVDAAPNNTDTNVGYCMRI